MRLDCITDINEGKKKKILILRSYWKKKLGAAQRNTRNIHMEAWEVIFYVYLIFITSYKFYYQA